MGTGGGLGGDIAADDDGHGDGDGDTIMSGDRKMALMRLLAAARRRGVDLGGGGGGDFERLLDQRPVRAAPAAGTDISDMLTDDAIDKVSLFFSPWSIL